MADTTETKTKTETTTQTPEQKPASEPVRGKRGKRFVRRSERPRPEFEQKILTIRRVSRVVAGGRRFSFSVAIAVGDRKGTVGVGLGKAGDTALAIEKAVNHARRNLVHVPLTDSGTIPHAVAAKYCASCVEMRPSPGRGLVAGSTVRNVLQLAGVSNVVAKLHSRSGNHLNNARAALAALAKIKGAEKIDKSLGGGSQKEATS